MGRDSLPYGLDWAAAEAAFRLPSAQLGCQRLPGKSLRLGRLPAGAPGEKYRTQCGGYIWGYGSQHQRRISYCWSMAY